MSVPYHGVPAHRMSGFVRLPRGVPGGGDFPICHSRIDSNYCSSLIRDATLFGIRLSPHRSLSSSRSRSVPVACRSSSNKRSESMTVQFLRWSIPGGQPDVPMPNSALVRRLLFRSHNDPARQRVLKWLAQADEERLQSFGLTPEDIVLLRRTA